MEINENHMEMQTPWASQATRTSVDIRTAPRTAHCVKPVGYSL